MGFGGGWAPPREDIPPEQLAQRSAPRISFADPPVYGPPAPVPLDRALPVYMVEDRRTYWENIKRMQDEYNQQQQAAQQQQKQAALQQHYAEAQRVQQLAGLQRGILGQAQRGIDYKNVNVGEFPSYEAAEAEALKRSGETSGVRLVEKPNELAIPELPYMQKVQDAVGEGIRATAPIAERLPGVGPLQYAGAKLPYVPTPTGVAAEAAEAVIPTNLLELELLLMPGIGEVPGGVSALNNLLRKTGGEITESVIRKFAASEAGKTFIDDVARVAGRLADETGAVPVPSGPRVLDQPAGQFIDPPEIGRLADEVPPNTAVKERAAEALAKAEFETRGGVARGVGRTAAAAIERILTIAGDRPAQLGQHIRTWLSSEARRFDRPLREAVTRYWRDVTASRVWATEQGSQIGRQMKDTFGKPNADFIGADGQPVFFLDSTGTNIKLTNRDAVENYHLFVSRMTPEQRAAAQANGDFIKRMRAEASDRGVRLSSARDVEDGEVQSYVHRSVIEKDGTYFAEYGDVQRPGAKTSAEENRHYVSAAEGKKNGIRYSDSWEEEYIAYLAGLRRRMSDVSLKEWTDSVSETLTERMLRKYPTQAAGREAANAARVDADRILKMRQAEIQKRYRARAQQKVREAQRATLKAQRALDKATVAPKLDDVRVKQVNAMKVGQARERLAAAVKAGNAQEVKRAQTQLDGLTTQQALQAQVQPRTKLVQDVGRAREALAAATRDLSDAANLSVDALWRRMDDADRIALQQARADVELTRNGATAANKAWGKKAQGEIEHLAPTAARAPGGTALPITTGRIFESEDALVLRELAEDMQQHPDNALLNIARVPVRALNLVTLTVDNSFFGVQGALFFLTRPFKWAAAVAQAPIAAASPRFRQRWLLTHMDGVRWVQKNVAEAFDANPDFIERGSVLHRVGETIKPIGYFSQLFNDARTMSAVYLAEGMKGTARNAQEEYDLGSSILKMVGLSRTVGAEKDVLLAARFFRSKIGLGFDALTNAGVQGRVARQQFARLMGTATTATLAYQYFVRDERDPRKLMESITPGRPNAFEIEGVNLLGSFATEINTLGKIAQGDNPLEAAKFYGESKLNFLLEGLISGYRGENLIGQPTSHQEEFFSLKAMTPLSIQQAIHNIKYQDAPWQIAIPAAFLGVRYSPPTQYERLADLGEKYGVDMDNYFSEPGTRDAANREFPDLAQAHKEWEAARRHGTVGQRTAQSIIDTSRARISGKIAEIRGGDAAPEKLREFTQTESDTRRTLRDALLGEFGEQDGDLDPLWGTFDLATNPETGELDFDKQQQFAEAILRKQPELRARWEAQQYIPITNDPMEGALKEGQLLVARTTVPLQVGDEQREVSWYTVADSVWDLVKGDNPLTYSEYVAQRDQQATAAGVDTGYLATRDPLQKIHTDLTRQIRQAILAKEPKVGAALRVWYGTDIPDSELPAELQQQLADETAALYRSLRIESE